MANNKENSKNKITKNKTSKESSIKNETNLKQNINKKTLPDSIGLESDMNDDFEEVSNHNKNISNTKRYTSKNIFQTFILICAFVCIIYGLYINLKDNSNKNSEEQTLALSFSDIKKLYSYITLNSYDLPFYSESEITKNSISTDFLFTLLVTTESPGKCQIDLSYPCNVYKVHLNDAYNLLREKYGNIDLISDNYTYGNISCTKDENNNYNCDLIKENNNSYKILTSLVDYKELDDRVIIYDKFLKYDTKNQICYVNNDMTKICANSEDFINNLQELNSDKLVEKYGQKYIHTYLKQNDKIYWYSSKMDIEN
ncbi:MAG: hypothetical protein NC181_03585 [Clostridium sp.]|nr:hypothetical protein [Clostridium sp.]MCM1444406.1 hypothetical protein [Candidatus Amulumruptor caecigallinarius]